MQADDCRSLRVLTVLEQLAHTHYAQTLAQLAQRTGLPKSSLLRILQSLEQAAYVMRVPGDGGYMPGPRAHQLATGLLGSPHFLRASRHVLGRLVGIIGESCNLTALAGDTVQYLSRVESPEPMRLQLRMEIGARVPLHCTASGKLFLALAPELQRRQMMDRIALHALTPRSLVDRTRLEEALDSIRSQRIGIDNEEFVRGMVAIAVPVYDEHEQLVAALACHAATAQRSMAELLQFAGPMREAAEEMAALFRRPALEHDDTTEQA